MIWCDPDPCSACQDVLPEVAPKTPEERKRVMHKSYSLDMFDESPMEWLVPDGQGTDQLRTKGIRETSVDYL